MIPLLVNSQVRGFLVRKSPKWETWGDACIELFGQINVFSFIVLVFLTFDRGVERSSVEDVFNSLSINEGKC